jgi:AcrR family transcriptional regulator
MGRRPEINGRELLLEAALRLFAEHGVDAVSIRAVNREAGLGPASVHYHFGTKEELLRAVLRERGVALVADVRARAKELAGSSDAVSSRDLVLMLAAPYVRLAQGGDASGHEWIRLLSQLLQSDPDRVIDRKTAKATVSAVARVYPDAGSVEILRAVRMCFTLLMIQLAHGSAAGRRRRSAVDLDLLVDFLSGGLDATLGKSSAATPRRTA